MQAGKWPLLPCMQHACAAWSARSVRQVHVWTAGGNDCCSCVEPTCLFCIVCKESRPVGSIQRLLVATSRSIDRLSEHQVLLRPANTLSTVCALSCCRCCSHCCWKRCTLTLFCAEQTATLLSRKPHLRYAQPISTAAVHQLQVSHLYLPCSLQQSVFPLSLL